jgi:hypothetical protein
MPITFVTLQAYLDKIAAAANGDILASVHGPFWQGTYSNFINGNILGTACGNNDVPAGSPIPIINKVTPISSGFYVLLQRAGWCGKTQMPGGARPGLFITDAGYTITMDDGTVVTGAKIIQDIGDWLNAGFPEGAAAVS